MLYDQVTGCELHLSSGGGVSPVTPKSCMYINDLLCQLTVPKYSYLAHIFIDTVDNFHLIWVLGDWGGGGCRYTKQLKKYMDRHNICRHSWSWTKSGWNTLNLKLLGVSVPTPVPGCYSQVSRCVCAHSCAWMLQSDRYVWVCPPLFLDVTVR